MLHPLCMGGASLNTATTLEPKGVGGKPIKELDGKGEAEKVRNGSLATFFAASFLHSVFNTIPLPSEHSKSMGMREAGVWGKTVPGS